MKVKRTDLDIVIPPKRKHINIKARKRYRDWLELHDFLPITFGEYLNRRLYQKYEKGIRK